MRVIAGEFRSRKLVSLAGATTRPTPDRLRETLFSILMPVIEGAVFVDAFAGTGSVGIEAISRGARLAIFIEKNKEAVEVIKENLSSLKIKDRGKLIRGSAVLHLANVADAIVFIDPPYESARDYEAIFETLAAHPPKLAIVQHSVRFQTPESCGTMERYRLLKQGDNGLSFYRLKASSIST
jgi:16S rRNA (guanine(966)-N(2))-methyltransferase RsmD